MQASDLGAWTPWRLTIEKPEPLVDWADLSGTRFSEPFFGETLLRLQDSGDLATSVRTGLSGLAAVEQAVPGRDPDGFIFHLARCGSTLVSSLPAQLPDVAVLSEADPVNNLLELGPDVANADVQAECLRLLLRAIGRGRGGAGRFLVKMSSWNICRIDIVRRAFPNVPWCFVYRDPVEVIASLLATPPAWMRLREAPAQAEAILGIRADDIARMTAPEFAVAAIERFIAAALAGDDGGAFLVEYRELPDAIWNRVLPFFGRDCSDEEVQRLGDAAKWHAKSPGQIFIPDSSAKRAALSAHTLALIASRIDPLYQILDQRRHGPMPIGTFPSRRDSP